MLSVECLNLQERVIQSAKEFDSNSLVDIVPELPLWVMSPDYERVSYFRWFSFGLFWFPND